MLAAQKDTINLSDSITTHKKCTKCNQSKLLSEFSKDKRGIHGVRYKCKVCESIQKKDHYQANKEQKIESSRVYRENNKEIIAERKKSYYQANKESDNRKSKEWYKNNKNKARENNRIWRTKNKTKDIERKRVWQRKNKLTCSRSSKNWRYKNIDKCRSYDAKRRAAKKNAFPLWARTGEIKNKIDAIYKEAKDLELFHGIAYHVDHIVPLQSNFVCGLHVPANLQPLVGSENFSKNNSFTPYIEVATDVEIDMTELNQMVDSFLANRS